MSKDEKILKITEANLRLEGMHLTSEEKQTIKDCLTGKTNFDKEIKKLVAYYNKVAA
ncbi:hypothetical protein IJI64_02315 [Candidatus Saccharibacteria bacterium]|nr:hypothetical protein [Candidatus Saccharibacteria bacterium]